MKTLTSKPTARPIAAAAARPPRFTARSTAPAVRVRASACGEARFVPLGDHYKLWDDVKQMSKEEKRVPRPENVEGDFVVDQSCIDCMTCRWVAPETFQAVGIQSAVARQPSTPEERLAAMQALYSCPVFAIHVTNREPSEVKSAQASLPRAWPTEAPGVYHCGWHSEASFGGTGWLIVRPEGNVLVDSPRFNPTLAKKIEAMGGVKYIFLTHRDDVADHAKWADHFKAQRIIHAGEASAKQGTDKCEIQLEGEGPVWEFPDGSGDLKIIYTPGHTAHHIVLYSDKHKALFSGDHLCGIEQDRTHWKLDGRLHIFTEECWYSVPEQLKSMQRLLDFDWLHVLPGHGVPARVRDAADRLKSVADLMARFPPERLAEFNSPSKYHESSSAAQ